MTTRVFQWTGWQRGFPWRVVGPKLSAWCVTGPKWVAWGVIWAGSVMGEFYFHNAWHAIFLWNFCAGECHLKQEAETLKIDSYDTSFLPFFLLSRPLISSDQMIIYTCLSRITEKLKRYINYIMLFFPWCVMRERYPHFATLSEARAIYVLTTEILIN